MHSIKNILIGVTVLLPGITIESLEYTKYFCNIDFKIKVKSVSNKSQFKVNLKQKIHDQLNIGRYLEISIVDKLLHKTVIKFVNKKSSSFWLGNRIFESKIK